MQHWMVKWCVNDEVKRILEEALLGYGKSCSGMSLEGLKLVAETLSHIGHCLDSWSAKCETGGQANCTISALVKFTVGMYIWQMLFT